MDSPSASGGATDIGAVYEAAMARRNNDQERVEGAQAVQLIEGAAAAARPLPADATLSVRV